MFIDFYQPGRMIWPSKSGYIASHPGHYVVFNANICIKDGKIWYGDLDLTLDEERLVQLRQDVGQDLYILSEHDARWGKEANPDLERAVAIVRDGVLEYQHRW